MSEFYDDLQVAIHGSAEAYEGFYGIGREFVQVDVYRLADGRLVAWRWIDMDTELSTDNMVEVASIDGVPQAVRDRFGLAPNAVIHVVWNDPSCTWDGR